MMRVPFFRLGIGMLVVLVASAACDSDPASPAPLTIQDLTVKLADIVGADPPALQGEKGIIDLARQTCKVMAQSGGCDDPTPSATFSREGIDVASGILSLLPAHAPRSAIEPEASFDAPAASPPLGTTCVWNSDADAWTGGSPIFGEVPGDRTRFEGYRTELGGPVLPLERTEDFFDVAPIEQNTPSEPRSQVNVEVERRRATGGAVVSLLLAGRINPGNGDVVDLLMSGRSGSGPASALDYVFAIDRDRAVNTVEVQDIRVMSRIDAAGSASMFVQKRSDPRQAVEFEFRIGSGGLTIASGDVYVGQERVATISGDRQTPTFQLTDPGTFREEENLEFIYEHLLGVDVRVVDLFFFGYCIGANTPNVCDNMRSRFGVG